MSDTKKCTKCGKIKQMDSFYKNKNHYDGLAYICKRCDKIISIEYNHSKRGVVTYMYAHQSYHSIGRNHPPPDYTKEELKIWLFAQPNFELIYQTWADSAYSKDLRPSIDRLNDYKPYSLDNIQLMTWRDNNNKGNADRINGINNKQSRVVFQYDKQGNFIKEHYSVAQAARTTGVHRESIPKACRGELSHTGGFIWKYK